MIPRIKIAGAWVCAWVFGFFLISGGAGALGSEQRNGSPVDLIQDISIDSLTVHIRALENAGGHRSRVTFTPGNDSAALYIKRRFDALPGLTSVAFDTFYVIAQTPYSAKPLTNVVATLQGTAQPSRVFILGAHFDGSASRMGTTIWNAQWSTIAQPGADDNATGVAAILEIARVLSDPSSGFRSDITLKFIAFASEESGPAHSGGHGGSNHYAAAARSRGEEIVGMVSVDMIGYNPSNMYTAVVSDTPSAWLGTRFRRALDSTGISLLTNSRPYPTATYSDHETFWNYGYPAILLIENAPPWTSTPLYAANPFYHTSYDSLGTVNLELVRRVTQGLLAMTVAMGGTPTGVEPLTEPLPTRTALLQNYPNPFNPSTQIGWEMERGESVRIAVYDLLGREVSVLFDGWKEAGRYTASFNGAGLPSGVYLCRLRAGSVSSTMKLTLLR
jgi:Peptidase family M28/Secretion system C-terminal sorting domain